MTALLFLLAAAWLAFHAARQPWAAAGAVIAAACAGTTLPDLDLLLGIGHRSGLTHSVLPAALCARRRWWTVAAGLLLGIGLHLSADLFPNAMRGFALVKLPGAGSIGRDGSYRWLSVNVALGLAGGVLLTMRHLPGRPAALALAAVALIGAAYLFRTDGGWVPLILFVVAGALWIRRRRLQVQ